jgi:hypothetical protein
MNQIVLRVMSSRPTNPDVTYAAKKLEDLRCATVVVVRLASRGPFDSICDEVSPVFYAGDWLYLSYALW